MFPSREYPRWTPLGPVLLQLFACTLSDDFEPRRIGDPPAQEEAAPSVLPAPMLEQMAVLPAAAAEPQHPEDEAPANCSTPSELPGCELMRVAAMPQPNADCSADS